MPNWREEATGLLSPLRVRLASVSTPQLWKNLWIAGHENGLEVVDCWLWFCQASRCRHDNCMERLELLSRNVNFTPSSPLSRGKYSCFKGFHRSALLQRYNSLPDR